MDRLTGFDERVSELLTQVEDLAHESNHDAMALLHCALYALGRSMGIARTVEQVASWNALSKFLYVELNQDTIKSVRDGGGLSKRDVD